MVQIIYKLSIFIDGTEHTYLNGHVCSVYADCANNIDCLSPNGVCGCDVRKKMFKFVHLYVWSPAGCMSHPKFVEHCSSARHVAPNDPLAIQS